MAAIRRRQFETHFHEWIVPIIGTLVQQPSIPHKASRLALATPPTQPRTKASERTIIVTMNEKLWISIRISLKFVLKGPEDNRSELFQVMAWHRTDGNPLPEPMLTQFADAYMRQ